MRKFDPSASEAWDHRRDLELGAELEEVDPRALCGGGGGRLEEPVVEEVPVVEGELPALEADFVAAAMENAGISEDSCSVGGSSWLDILVESMQSPDSSSGLLQTSFPDGPYGDDDSDEDDDGSHLVIGEEEDHNDVLMMTTPMASHRPREEG